MAGRNREKHRESLVVNIRYTHISEVGFFVGSKLIERYFGRKKKKKHLKSQIFVL